MKLEFCDDPTIGADNYVMRLYDFSKEEAASFQQAVQQTLLVERKPLNVGALEFVEALNCRLMLCLAEHDVGIVPVGDNAFVCQLTNAGYEEMALLLEPFYHDSSGFQYLYDLDTPIDFVFSVNGWW